MAKMVFRNAEEGWVELVAPVAEEGLQVNVSRNIHFSSSQLPKNWKHHKGAFDKNGKTEFRRAQLGLRVMRVDGIPCMAR